MAANAVRGSNLTTDTNTLQIINTASLKRCLTLFVFGSSLLLQGIVNAETPISSSTAQLSATEIAAKYGNEAIYTVTRDGKKIGNHTLSFSQSGNELVVSVDSSIKVTILKIPVYRLSYESEERWVDDELVTVVSKTIENGDVNSVSLDNTTTSKQNALSFASNHWHSGVLASHSLFNTLNGEVSTFTITDLGPDEVKTKSGILLANRYRYSEDIEADVWYDQDGLWLQMEFIGERGSVIKYLRNVR